MMWFVDRDHVSAGDSNISKVLIGLTCVFGRPAAVGVGRFS